MNRHERKQKTKPIIEKPETSFKNHQINNSCFATNRTVQFSLILRNKKYNCELLITIVVETLYFTSTTVKITITTKSIS